MRCFATIREHEFEVEAFDIKEQVSGGFHSEVILYGDSSISIGDRINLWLAEAMWTGLIASITQVFESLDHVIHNGSHYYRLTFCSNFEYICRSILCDIHQDIELILLFSKLLKGVEHEIDTQLIRKYEYLFQYHESTVDLIRYLTSNNGLYYYFNHRENKLIITNTKTLEKNNLYFVKVRPPDQIHEYIDSISVKQGINFSEYYRFGFSLNKPEIPLKSHISNLGSGAYQEYDTNSIQMDQLVINNQQMISNREYLLETHNPLIRAGSSISIHGSQLDGEYFTTQITHHYTRLKYINKLILIKDGFKSQPTRLKAISSLVGTVTDEVHLRAGKVKVTFPWTKAQLFIPILLPTCGNGYGASIIPHPGQRVLVLFEAGRPFIGGSFYDGSHLSCYGDNPNLIGIKTKPNKNNKYNEIVLDETRENESIAIVAAKDMRETIEDTKQTKIVQGNLKFEIMSGSAKMILAGKQSVNEVEIKTGNNITKIDIGSNILRISKGDSIVEIVDGRISLTIENGGLEINAPEVLISSETTRIQSKSIDILTSEGKINADNLAITAKGVITISGSLINFNTA